MAFDLFLQPLPLHPRTLTVQHIMEPRFISTAPVDFVENSVSSAASHLQAQPLAVQDACFYVNDYSHVYGIPAVSAGQAVSLDLFDVSLGYFFASALG